MPATIIQIKNKLQREFARWDIQSDISRSTNEENTKNKLIEKFLTCLGYDDDDLEYEFDTGFGNADIAVKIGRKYIMLIEAKSATKSLTPRNLKQLSDYFTSHSQSRFGLLTNGKIYNFYSVSWKNNKYMNQEPFIEFDIENYSGDDLEKLSVFAKELFDADKILEDATSTQFYKDFLNAFTKVLYPPEEEIIKRIYNKMNEGKKRINLQTTEKIAKLINHFSLEEVLENLKLHEANDAETGVYTTTDEIRAFRIIRSHMIADSTDIRNNSERIGFKDYKNHFSIVFDGMPSKEICRLKLKDSSKKIEINGKEEQFGEVSDSGLVKYKSKLVRRFIN